MHPTTIFALAIIPLEIVLFNFDSAHLQTSWDNYTTYNNLPLKIVTGNQIRYVDSDTIDGSCAYY